MPCHPGCTTDTSDERLSRCLSRGPPPAFPFMRQRWRFSAISTFTSHEPTPASRGTDVANAIAPSPSPVGNWSRNTAKEAANTETRVFGSANARNRDDSIASRGLDSNQSAMHVPLASLLAQVNHVVVGNAVDQLVIGVDAGSGGLLVDNNLERVLLVI